MHELGIVFHIIDTIEQVGAERQLSEVSAVTLEIGEVSTVIPSYLEDCWNWAVKRTKLLADAQLKCEIIKGITVCENCEKTYETVKYGKICPFCSSPDTHLLTGNEVNIKEIEAV